MSLASPSHRLSQLNLVPHATVVSSSCRLIVLPTALNVHGMPQTRPAQQLRALVLLKTAVSTQKPAIGMELPAQASHLAVLLLEPTQLHAKPRIVNATT